MSWESIHLEGTGPFSPVRPHYYDLAVKECIETDTPQWEYHEILRDGTMVATCGCCGRGLSIKNFGRVIE